MKDAALYIHIPFCEHKCIYCDFYSIITSENQIEFIKSLKREIDFYALEFADKLKFNTIFFGGGTPSILDPPQLDEILNHLLKNFSFNQNLEITLETNPGTVNKEKLKLLKQSGINRLSIGIQSFDDSDLDFLTRIHNKQTAIKTVNDAFNCGFDNINIDLIFNLPNQTKNKWKKNLELACTLPISHISTYSLILERGTILNKLVIDGKVKIQDEDYDADLYQCTIEYLTNAGFIQYEVSNFAKDGFECLHNLSYWQHRDYLGFGPSAHSFYQNKRWWNFTSLKRYIDEISQKGNAVMNQEILSTEELQAEFIMLALRSKGLNLQQLSDNFGEGWIKKARKDLLNYIQSGYIKQEDNTIKLTATGYAVCDEILKNIL